MYCSYCNTLLYSTVLICWRDGPYSTCCTNSVQYSNYLHILESLLLNSVWISFKRNTVQLLCPYVILLNDPVMLMLSIRWKTTWSSTIWVWISLVLVTLLAITIFTRAISCSAVRSLRLPPIDGHLSVLQKWNLTITELWSSITVVKTTLRAEWRFSLYALQHYMYHSNNKENDLFSLLKVRTLDATV